MNQASAFKIMSRKRCKRRRNPDGGLPMPPLAQKIVFL